MTRVEKKAREIAKKLEPEIKKFEKFILEKHPEVIERLKKIITY